MGLINSEIQQYCKLYKGEDRNPFHPVDVCEEQWAKEYLKFHVWDAELSFIENPSSWKELTGSDDIEEAYKTCVFCKLRKMGAFESIDWMELYKNLTEK